VAYLGFGKGGHGERAEREPIRGVWGRSPQRGSGAEPLVGESRGRSPLKLKHFLFLNVQWKPQIRPFLMKFAEKRQKHTFSYKVACKKFSWSGQRGASHHALPKYATVSN